MLLMVLVRWPAVRCQKKDHAAGGIPHYPRLTFEASCAVIGLRPCIIIFDTPRPAPQQALAGSVSISLTQNAGMHLECPHLPPSGHQRQQPLVRWREVRFGFRIQQACLHDTPPEGSVRSNVSKCVSKK